MQPSSPKPTPIWWEKTDDTADCGEKKHKYVSSGSQCSKPIGELKSIAKTCARLVLPINMARTKNDLG